MKVSVEQSIERQERHQVRADNFWSQTVQENNQRLNGKNIPQDVLDEIKFIQSVLLSNLKHKKRPADD